MPDFTEKELLQIIAASETDRVEFKESLSGDAATRIRETICAFANDLAEHEKPGRILNEKRRHGDRPFDLQPVSFATVSDLNLFQFEHEYLPQAFDREILEANERSLEERLAAAKMIVSADDPVPTLFATDVGCRT